MAGNWTGGFSASQPSSSTGFLLSGIFVCMKATALTEYCGLVETRSPCIFTMLSRISWMAGVMVNFMGHLDCTKGCPHSW